MPCSLWDISSLPEIKSMTSAVMCGVLITGLTGTSPCIYTF